MQKGFEAVKAVAPEGAVEMKPVDHGGQRIGLGAVVRFASLTPVTHQLCPLEHGKVLGDSRLRYARMAGQRVDSLFAMAS